MISSFLKTCLSSLTTAVVLSLSVSVTSVDAKPKVSVVNKTYLVDATTVQGLRKQMKQRGPKGHWAYTDWYVKWSGSCKLSVKITYTMPRHKNEGKLDPALRKRWKAMVRALKAHEEKHGAHGVQAAREIEKTRCANGDAVIKKWNKQDKVLDKRTKHGKTEGVVLQ
ncbi:DUF922 domain-containing protein [Alisedimentitalea sp. MJ-SS2]|uniref:DUF922 domain-containing protein n=1 Tax=Aliisedimentitalea sp. MJ-SS2 TaxID=3049795 RepID=UPI00291581B7|nr:DUF922 domain-containing protein [Alisedimentitalea sp. MJ-SS2]MDU8927935.1 DUF922 domain-containing protein [Alisedimentitalea sp. MJ-SS2]